MLLILIASIIAETIIALLHLFVYKSIILFLGASAHWVIVVLRTVFIVGAMSFLASSWIATRWHNRLTRMLYLLSSIWLAAVYVYLVASIIGLIIYLILTFTPEQKLYFGLVLYSIATLVIIYSLVRTVLIKIKNIDLYFPNLPEYWRGKQIVFISDIHFGPIYYTNFSKKITSIIEKLNPETLLIGGDLFDGTEVGAEEALIPLSKLNTKFGTYYITGNHESFDGSANKFMQAIESAGFKVLHNKSADLNGLVISGIDYLETRKIDDLKNVLESLSIDKNKANILLKHVPSYLNLVADKGFDAVLCGHTHNGQMYPFGLFAKMSYGYNYGLHWLKNTQIFVSSGLGTWGPPARLGSRSEIVLITLKEKK